MVTGADKGEDGLGLGGMPGGDGQGTHTAFEAGDALLKDIVGGVHDAGVDVAKFLEGKQVGGMFGVFELVGGSLIDGDGTGPGGGVGNLSGVKLAGVETKFVFFRFCTHDRFLFFRF